MATNLEQGIIDCLESAVDDKLENYEVQVHEGNQKGAGYLGEMTFVSLKNKKTGKDVNIVVKMVRPSKTEASRNIMSSTYFNEIHCYTKVIPALLEFQKLYPEVKPFDNFAKCYATCSDSGFEKLALENLKFKNYEIHASSVPLDTKSFEMIFKMYADYHALGFAFKHHQPELFLETTKDLYNNWLEMQTKVDMMMDYLKHFINKLLGYLEEESEDEIFKKLEKYVEDLPNIFRNSVTYNDSYGTIIHGDCWSNNLMIKYNSSREIEHIKMIDLQIGYVASPVLDLMYSLYSGAGKESLDNLEKLLKLYHDNLSKNLEKYGCDPEKIYPFDILKKEWKKHCPFGFLMSVMLWVNKLATDLTDMPTTNEMMDGQVDATQLQDFGIKYDQKKYKKIVLDLIKHLNDHDYL